MKKSKLFILLPLMTLCLSSCDAIFGSTSSGSSSASSETSGSTSYDSYTLSFTFLYRGSEESAPESSSIYLYSELTSFNYTPLVENGTKYETTLGYVDFGTYTYSLYIEYQDNEVSGESPLIYDGSLTIGSSGATQDINVSLSSTLTEILGEKDSGGAGETGTRKPGAEYIENFTLTITLYDSTGTTQKKAPDGYNLYIAGDMDGTWTETDEGSWYEWGDYVQLNENTDSEGSVTYSYTFGYVEKDSSPTFNIEYATDEDSRSWDNRLSLEDNYSFTLNNTSSQSITCKIDSSLDSIFTDVFTTGGETGEGGDTGSGSTDGGKPDATYIHDFTLVVTIYDSTGAKVKKAPDNYDLYIAGDMDGTWTIEETGSWYTWCDFAKLTETTDEDGNVAYTYTFGYVEANSKPEYNIYYTTSGSAASWDYKLSGSSNFSFDVDSGATDNYTQYVTCTIDSDLDNFMKDAIDSGDTGGDDNPNTGDEGSTTFDDTITLYFTFTYDGNTQTIPNDGKVFINGSWDDANWLDTNVPTLQYDSITGYYYAEVTYDGDNVMNGHWFTYSLFLAGINDNFSWDDSIRLLDESSNLWWSYNDEDASSLTKTETITLTDTFENLLGIGDSGETGDEGLKPGATYVNNYTLTITLYDSDGHMKQCPSGGAIYMASGINGPWNTDYDGYWDWGDPVKLNENVTEDGVTYSYTYPSVVDGETYSYNLLYSSNGTTYDWNTDELGTNDFTFTVDSGIYDGYSQSIVCTATSEIINSFDTVTGFDADGYTLVFTIYDSNNNLQTCPSWGYLSLQGDFTTTAGGSWDSTYYDMSETVDQSGNIAYSVHFTQISAGNHSFNIMFTYTGESVSWTPIRTNGNFSCTTADGLAEGTYYFNITGSNDIAASFPSHEGATEYNIYLCIVDTSNSNASSINNVYVGSDDDIFPNNGDAYHNWDNVTKTTTTYNGHTAYAAYQSSTMTMYANDNHWARFYDDNKSYYYFEFTVPENMGTDICFVVFADCSKFDAWSASPTTWSAACSGTWYSGTPATVFATGF